jgi:hypothetical protein
MTHDDAIGSIPCIVHIWRMCFGVMSIVLLFWITKFWITVVLTARYEIVRNKITTTHVVDDRTEQKKPNQTKKTQWRDAF